MKSCYTVLHGCPCGYFSDPKHDCRCSYQQIHRYRSKISGPLLDRIDLHVEVQRLGSELFIGRPSGAEPSSSVRERVRQARARQLTRSGKLNSALSPSEVERDCALDGAARKLLETAVKKLGLSARGWQRVIKVARTIGDLANEDTMTLHHLSEAISYRNLDRPVRT